MEKLPQPPHLNIRQWIRLSAALLAAIMVLITCIAVAQHLADAQFIGSNELDRSIGDLQSYSAEAQTLETETRRGSALRTYTETYSSTLQDAVDSVAEKLTEHPHADNLQSQVATTIQLANSLSGQLQQLSTEPTGQLPDEKTANLFYANLQNSLKEVDATL